MAARLAALVEFAVFLISSTIISNADKDEQQPLSAFLLAVRGESNSERGAELSKARERLCQHSAQGGTSCRARISFTHHFRAPRSVRNSASTSSLSSTEGEPSGRPHASKKWLPANCRARNELCSPSSR